MNIISLFDSMPLPRCNIQYVSQVCVMNIYFGLIVPPGFLVLMLMLMNARDPQVHIFQECSTVNAVVGKGMADTGRY